jgi:hypothetical protein
MIAIHLEIDAIGIMSPYPSRRILPSCHLPKSAGQNVPYTALNPLLQARFAAERGLVWPAQPVFRVDPSLDLEGHSMSGDEEATEMGVYDPY